MNKHSIIAVTPGEPAGVGPDLIVRFAQHNEKYPIVVIADKNLLQERAKKLNLKLKINEYKHNQTIFKPTKQEINVLHIPLNSSCTPGILNHYNSEYVIQCLDKAIIGCLNNKFSALVTGPIQKSIINKAGIKFSGHTEYLQKKSNINKVVMLLASNKLKVALVTTHLPLKQVAPKITKQNLVNTIKIIINHYQNYKNIKNPNIKVAGLNPHAGEHGYLGHEEIEIINPVINQFQKLGFNISGAYPADTLFTNNNLETTDIFISMFHDQGLPVLKALSFNQATNITMGLPFIRTSVDHGTALDLAGTGLVNHDSFIYSIQQAFVMLKNKNLASSLEVV